MLRSFVRIITIASIFVTALKGQNISIQSQDTITCIGDSVLLVAQIDQVASTDIVFCGPFCDDYITSYWIPLGFNFVFYDHSYTQCLASTNNYIAFSGTPGSPSTWFVNINSPAINNPGNSIMMPWKDLMYDTNSIAHYKTIGNAPNRKFIYEYMNARPVGCASSNCSGAQIQLYETSNIIEIHLFKHIPCISWSGGRALMGIQDSTGTLASIIPGRNGASPAWTVLVPEAFRWTPTSPSTYNISSISYSPEYLGSVPLDTAVHWFENGNLIGSGDSIYVMPNSTTTYFCSIPTNDCSGIAWFEDSISVEIPNTGIDSIYAIPSYICAGDSIQLFAAFAGDSLLWETFDTAWYTINSNSNPHFESISSPGLVQFRAINISMCETDTSNLLSINVDSLSYAGNISSIPLSNTIYLGDTIFLLSNSYVGLLEWFGTNPSDTLFSSIGTGDSVWIVPPDTGIFEFICMGQNGICFNDTSSIITYHVIDTTSHLGLMENHQIDLSVYPNPSSGQFKLQFATSTNKIAIQVYDILGEIIFIDKYIVKDNSIYLNLSDQPCGIYYLALQIESQHRMLKLIKQ